MADRILRDPQADPTVGCNLWVGCFSACASGATGLSARLRLVG